MPNHPDFAKTIPSRSCEDCSKPFYSNRRNQRFCSQTCNRTHWAVISGKSKNAGLASATVGAISEYRVAIDLLRLGYTVFRAVSPACFCDLVALKDDRVLRIEVRTGYLSLNGTISFPTNRRGEVDCFAVYVLTNDSIHYLNLDKTPRGMS